MLGLSARVKGRGSLDQLTNWVDTTLISVDCIQHKGQKEASLSLLSCCLCYLVLLLTVAPRYVQPALESTSYGLKALQTLS